MKQVNIEELERVCKPVVEYMKKNCSPHETIVITDEQFKIVADTIVIPANGCESQRIGLLAADEQSDLLTKN